MLAFEFLLAFPTVIACQATQGGECRSITRERHQLRQQPSITTTTCSDLLWSCARVSTGKRRARLPTQHGGDTGQGARCTWDDDSMFDFPKSLHTSSYSFNRILRGNVWLSSSQRTCLQYQGFVWSS